MTGEQIVGTSTEHLESLNDDQLLEWVMPLLEATRPKPENLTPEEPKPKKIKAKAKPKTIGFMEQARALLEQVQKDNPTNE